MIPYGKPIIKVEWKTGFTKTDKSIPINRKIIIKPTDPNYDEEYKAMEKFETQRMLNQK